MKYYWDTIAECVPPETIVAALRRTGFVDVEHRILVGCVSEYVALKPLRDRAPHLIASGPASMPRRP